MEKKRRGQREGRKRDHDQTIEKKKRKEKCRTSV